MYSSHSRMFQEVASLYVKDGYVIKFRGGCPDGVTKEFIDDEVNNKNRVIIEKDKYLYCYFNDDDIYIVENVIIYLKEQRQVATINKYVKIMR